MSKCVFCFPFYLPKNSLLNISNSSVHFWPSVHQVLPVLHSFFPNETFSWSELAKRLLDACWGHRLVTLCVYDFGFISLCGHAADWKPVNGHLHHLISFCWSSSFQPVSCVFWFGCVCIPVGICACVTIQCELPSCVLSASLWQTVCPAVHKVCGTNKLAKIWQNWNLAIWNLPHEIVRSSSHGTHHLEFIAWHLPLGLVELKRLQFLNQFQNVSECSSWIVFLIAVDYYQVLLLICGRLFAVVCRA